MPTIVWGEPVAAADRIKAGSAAAKIAPQIKRAIELTGKARSMIERGFKAGMSSISSPNASSTAKTQELKPAVAASSYRSHLGLTDDSEKTDTKSRTGSGVSSAGP